MYLYICMCIYVLCVQCIVHDFFDPSRCHVKCIYIVSHVCMYICRCYIRNFLIPCGITGQECISFLICFCVCEQYLCTHTPIYVFIYSGSSWVEMVTSRNKLSRNNEMPRTVFGALRDTQSLWYLAEMSRIECLAQNVSHSLWYLLASISRLLKIIGLFRRILSLL